MQMTASQFCWLVFVGLPIAIASVKLIGKTVIAVSRFVTWMDTHGPVLRGIAEQFKPNHGGSLHDKVEEIRGRLKSGDTRMDRMEGSIATMAANCPTCSHRPIQPSNGRSGSENEK